MTLPSLLFSSCLFEKTDVWRLDKINGLCPNFRASKLVFIENRETNCLEIEFRHTLERDYLFINLNSFYVRPEKEEDLDSKLEIFIQFNEEEKKRVCVHVLAGGQRLLFPEETASLIIERLLEENSCTFTIGKRTFTVPSNNFLTLYQEVIKSD